MNTVRVTTLIKALSALCAAALLSALLMTAPAEASSRHGHSTNPCPNYSIQNVFDNLHGDWDYDGVSNVIELYNYMNPCIPDSAAFCAVSGHLCARVVYVHVCTAGGGWYWHYVNAWPHGDWDGDGVSNWTEARYGANPCRKPCPHPTAIDVALNPHGDWDYDGISNQREVNHRTDPCNRHSRIHYTTPATTTRLPHVLSTTTPPTGYTCPVGYPHYYAGTHRCYKQPVVSRY